MLKIQGRQNPLSLAITITTSNEFSHAEVKVGLGVTGIIGALLISANEKTIHSSGAAENLVLLDSL